MNFNNIFITSIILLSSIAFKTEGCSCFAQHPQVQYCDADYVIVAKVLEENEINNTRTEYPFEIQKIWKANDEAYEYLQEGILIGGGKKAGTCRRRIPVGKTYIIIGKGIFIRLCQFIQEYSTTPVAQRKLIKREYQKGCECTVINFI